jgi:hypothetical protein
MRVRGVPDSAARACFEPSPSDLDRVAPGPATKINSQALGRPIRVVVFGGAFFERAALEFVALLDDHPEVELLGGFCQSRGFGPRAQATDVLKRRHLLGLPILCLHALQAALRLAWRPRMEFALRRRVRKALTRFAVVPDIHAPGVLNHVRALGADLGLVYGAPILRPELFEIPIFGTLGIHHGKLPQYRGKKTTFWAVYNGEASAGVAIQRIRKGLDRGEIVRADEVPIARKSYRRVAADVQQLGLRLYIDAIVAVKRGEGVYRPQPQGQSVMYGQPSARDFLSLPYRKLVAERQKHR